MRESGGGSPSARCLSSPVTTPSTLSGTARPPSLQAFVSSCGGPAAPRANGGHAQTQPKNRIAFPHPADPGSVGWCERGASRERAAHRAAPGKRVARGPRMQGVARAAALPCAACAITQQAGGYGPLRLRPLSRGYGVTCRLSRPGSTPSPHGLHTDYQHMAHPRARATNTLGGQAGFPAREASPSPYGPHTQPTYDRLVYQDFPTLGKPAPHLPIPGRPAASLTSGCVLLTVATSWCRNG